MQQQRVIPAVVFDYLAMAAEAYGGIGGGDYYSGGPKCAIGFGKAAQAEARAGGFGDPVSALRMAGISEGTNDAAVAAVNLRFRLPVTRRIPFEDWARELNVVRGN